jgi:hypothetical protein
MGEGLKRAVAAARATRTKPYKLLRDGGAYVVVTRDGGAAIGSVDRADQWRALGPVHYGMQVVLRTDCATRQDAAEVVWQRHLKVSGEARQ